MGTHILRILINLLVRKIVLVQGEVVIVLAQRQIIHLIDEVLELRVFLAGELLDLLPDFFALCILFSFSEKNKVRVVDEVLFELMEWN